MNRIIFVALISTCLVVAVLGDEYCVYASPSYLNFKAYEGKTLTNADCRSYCKEGGAEWAVTKNGNQCWCINIKYNLLSLDDVDPRSCNAPCTGNTNEKCGGPAHISTMSTTNLHYIGCYIDTATRDLAGPTSTTNNPYICIENCRYNGYKYAAVQSGNECYCGNSYGSYGAAPESNCLPCSGTDNLKTCGGPWRNSVYWV